MSLGLKDTLSLFVLLLFCTNNAKSQPFAPDKTANVSVCIFEQQKPTSLILKPQTGKFRVFAGGKMVAELGLNELLFVTTAKGKVRVRTIAKPLGSFTRILVKNVKDTATFSLRAIDTPLPPRIYCGNISFSATSNSIQSILEIDFEHYISGVVESEVGGKQVAEMYKVQAIIARTYALSNLRKHEADGYQLCDGVHCQAFKGLPTVKGIVEACEQTRDLVVVNRDNSMITAAFHANCGGQTVNSEDVWPKFKSYLRSTKCPYCATSKSYAWRLSIPIEKWATYIAEKGASSSDVIPKTYQQKSRKAYVEIGKVAIPLHTIRKDLALRSTYFSYKQVGDSIVFTGKGYGHGVGLCQDGASSMAKLNMPYEQIIAFYYKGCKVVNRQLATVETDSSDTPANIENISNQIIDSLETQTVYKKEDSTLHQKRLYPKRL